MRFGSKVEGCDGAVLLTLLRCALVEDVATRGVRSFVLTLLLEYQRGTLRTDSVELLLLCDEVHLGLRLHLVADLRGG